MVSMVAFQAVDPGSIPGHRIGLLMFDAFPVLVFPSKLHFQIPYCLVVRIPGFHPGSPAWEATISTAILVVLATALRP